MAKMTSPKAFVISAVTTPLHEDDSLHVEGLEAHLEEQWQAGIDGLLVAGTMGLMQLLTDRTYADLIEHALRISAGRGEIMVGVGDASLGAPVKGSNGSTATTSTAWWSSLPT